MEKLFKELEEKINNLEKCYKEEIESLRQQKEYLFKKDFTTLHTLMPKLEKNMEETLYAKEEVYKCLFEIGKNILDTKGLDLEKIMKVIDDAFNQYDNSKKDIKIN